MGKRQQRKTPGLKISNLTIKAEKIGIQATDTDIEISDSTIEAETPLKMKGGSADLRRSELKTVGRASVGWSKALEGAFDPKKGY